MASVNSDNNIELLPVLTIDLTKQAKGKKVLGFNILGGKDRPVFGDNGIFVCYVLPGGPAHLNGYLREGDKILSVNHHSLLYVTHDEAAKFLKGGISSGRVILQVQQGAQSYIARKILEEKKEARKKWRRKKRVYFSIACGGILTAYAIYVLRNKYYEK